MHPCRSATLLRVEIDVRTIFRHRILYGNSVHARLMYGYLSKTKQSLALKLMAIYTLKANILVHFFPPKLLTRFIRFQIAILPLLRNCAKFLPFYPSKFSIQIRYTFSLRFALNSFSARHQNCCLKRD